MHVSLKNELSYEDLLAASYDKNHRCNHLITMMKKDNNRFIIENNEEVCVLTNFPYSTMPYHIHKMINR